MKKNIFVCFLFSAFYLLFSQSKIMAFEINDIYYAVEKNENINLYKNNVLTHTFYKAKLLDLNYDYLLYNEKNKLYLYQLNEEYSIFISEYSYNAALGNNVVVYESDNDETYKCKNNIYDFNYHNCYNLYLYEIDSDNTRALVSNSVDSYINAIDENYIVYTSIHSYDNFCYTSACSYINIYNLLDNTNIVLENYDNLSLNMSGNASIDDGIVYFETVPKIVGCEYVQILSYDIENNSFLWVTKDDNSCFSYDNEIKNANNGYLIFSTKYNNYENNENQNYVYSYKNDKLDLVNNICKNVYDIKNDEKNIFCLIGDILQIYKFDTIPPTINVLKEYNVLQGEKEKFIKNLDVEDNLSNRSNIKINIIDNVDEIGEKYINIKVCDEFENCNTQEIFVNIISSDITGPTIYIEDSIIIKKYEILNLEKYGFGLDDIDGKLPIELITEVDFTKEGNEKILVSSTDLSGNVSYKEIELIIYDEMNLKVIYLMVSFFCISTIVLIRLITLLKNKK